MNRIRVFIPLIVALTILLIGCQGQPDQPHAPTSIPLPTPQAGSSAEPSNPPPRVIPPENPIRLPEGFGITVYAAGLTDPRMMDIGPDNMVYVSQPSTGQILRLPDRDSDGIADGIEVAAEDLVAPSGLAFFNDGSLYVAETTRVIRLLDPDGDGFFQDREVITAGIAAGGYTSRSIIFSPDWKHFYLSIGSSCNICLEQDPRRASVMRFAADGSSGKMFTKGLRHVVGMDFNPGNDILWVANDERHGLGDNLPPETIYAIYIDADAGWPYCHAGRILDPDHGDRDSCDNLLTPIFELEAHTTPFGITFYMGEQFPDEYQQDLFVALHGSSEGSQPAGYKLIRIPFGGGERGPVEDFAVGWLLEDGKSWGTPVDLIVGPDGSLFLSDDSQGVIYRIFYSG
jgi:glucose/arabinose dehydrogenase